MLYFRHNYSGGEPNQLKYFNIFYIELLLAWIMVHVEANKSSDVRVVI